MTDYSVNRATFDDVMVPNYAPQQVVPVRGNSGLASGIRKAKSTSTSLVVLP